MKSLRNPVQMAVIGAAHGIKGEVRIKAFTGDPGAIGDYGPLFTADGRRFEVLGVRPQGEVVVARLGGVSDRNQAEVLNGIALFIERDDLPADLEDDEFYHADLIGLLVRDGQGNELGRVKAVLNFGGGDILEIAGAVGETLIPFSKAAAPVVDLAGRTIVIDPVAAGLVDDGDEESGDDSTGGGEGRRRGFDARRRPRGPADAGGNR